MARVSDWFEMKIKPWHRGQYDVLHVDAFVQRAMFNGRSWVDSITKQPIDVSLLSGWRGRLQHYAASRIGEVMTTMEANHQRKYARPLFRHWVSMADTKKACRYFQIGETLGAKFTKTDKRAYKRLSNKLTATGASKVKTSVGRFFGQN